jgi:hypothetical protein
MNKRNWALNQIAFQEQITKIGINLVTCGSCGDVMFCKTDDEQIECICGVVSDAHDCPDLWYRGLENNYEEPIEYKITKSIKIQHLLVLDNITLSFSCSSSLSDDDIPTIRHI